MSAYTTDTLIQRERAAHWYFPDGRSCHTVPKKDGTGPRATMPEDARKLGLLPSVTSILRIKAKPELDAWKLEQAILSSLTLPRGEGESLDSFARRVVVDMESHSSQAAAWGTRIHAECEEMHRTGVMIPREETYPYMADYERWFKANILEVVHVEKTVVNAHVGYAGQLDLAARHKEWGMCVIDMKTQRVKEKPVFYEEWGMQLAAYREALPAGPVSLVSVIIDSGKPAPVAVKRWENPHRYMRAFMSCINLWRFDHHFELETAAAAAAAA